MDSFNKTAVGPLIAGNCLSCKGMVRISQATAVNAIVRCPHCKESFPFADLLDQALPALEVVSNDSTGDDVEAPYIDTLHIKREEQAAKPESPRTKFEIPKALKDGAKRRRRRRKRKSAEGNANGALPSTGPRASGSENRTSSQAQGLGRSNEPAREERERPGSSERSRSSQRPRGTSESGGGHNHVGERRSGGNRRSERSRRSVELSPESAAFRGKVKSRLGGVNPKQSSFETADVIKTAVGVMIAVPFAYLLLIWGFKADPLGFAKPISQVLPFAVPASMQGNSDRPEIANPEVISADLTDDVEPLAADDGGAFDESDVYEEPFEIKRRDSSPLSNDEERIAFPAIDPDEIWGEEFGL